MFEKVNPSHPDKVADRIAGAIVDLAYAKQETPKIAVEILIGHGACNIIAETSVSFEKEEIEAIVKRIGGNLAVNYVEVPQDPHLAENQSKEIKCGDNGIFKGVPVTWEEQWLTDFAKDIYRSIPYDGKYIVTDDKVIVCQSNVEKNAFVDKFVLDCDYDDDIDFIVNPLGYWTGGSDVDSGATNRKLGSDMAQSVTGGGLHGKDLSKADVSVNIFAFAMAQITGRPVELHCAIGDSEISGVPYSAIVGFAKGYIEKIGGFEKFAEWGLVR